MEWGIFLRFLSTELVRLEGHFRFTALYYDFWRFHYVLCCPFYHFEYHRHLFGFGLVSDKHEQTRHSIALSASDGHTLSFSTTTTVTAVEKLVLFYRAVLRKPQ